MCVCVCVRERGGGGGERERERERGEESDCVCVREHRSHKLTWLMMDIPRPREDDTGLTIQVPRLHL